MQFLHASAGISSSLDIPSSTKSLNGPTGDNTAARSYNYTVNQETTKQPSSQLVLQELPFRHENNQNTHKDKIKQNHHICM